MLLLFATITDPAVVLAVWTLACLAALGAGLTVAWAIQPRETDPFASPGRPQLVTNLWTETGHRVRHAAGLNRAAWKPMHTAAAVKRRGRHHEGRGRWAAPLIDKLGEDTQPVNRDQVFAAIDDYAERAA